MILKIANENRSIIRKGTYLFSLVEYPTIQEWEWNNIMAFISYEKAQGDNLEIVCDDDDILMRVREAADKLERALDYCMFEDKKYVITGRDTGATCDEFAAYVMDTVKSL